MLRCQRDAGRFAIRPSAGLSVFASHLPKQQLAADGSVFLIRLLQLWMVHSNQGAWQPPANTDYHTLAGEGEEEREEEGQRRRKRRGEEMAG